MKRVVIIEDEIQIRKDIEKMVVRQEGFTVAGTAGNLEDARALLLSSKPDVVFLDIQLGKRTAFELLEQLPSLDFEIIFATAHNQYAIKAIRCGALDYLLKPIDEQELREALARIRNNKTPSNIKTAVEVVQQRYSQPASGKEDRIVLRTQEGLHIITYDELVYCQSDGCYTTFYLADKKKVMISKPLKLYDELLPKDRFLRTHQSYIVNHHFVKKYLREGALLLRTDITIPVSVRRKDAVLSFLTKKTN